MLFNRNISSKMKALGCARNVGRIERLASAFVGGTMLLNGIRRRRWRQAFVGGGMLFRAASGHCELYHRLGINTTGKKAYPQTSVPHNQGVKVVSAITIDRPAAELYRYWRDLKNLPNFMSRLERLEVRDHLSHWTFKSVGGKTFSWDADIINDIPDQLIAWRTLDRSDIDHAGSVRFDPAPGGRGTYVRMTVEYRPPAGKIGSAAAWLLGTEPKQVMDEDLRRFKQIMETGEIPSVQGQPQASTRSQEISA